MSRTWLHRCLLLLFVVPLWASPAPAQELFNVCVEPDLVIPDEEAVASELEVVDVGEIIELGVFVDITHAFIGDLTVAVTSPSDVEVTLHAEDGFAGDDILATYTDEGRDNGFPYDCNCNMAPSGPGLMEDFQGELMQGSWVLDVADSIATTSGTLNEWCVAGEFTTISFLRGDANGDGEVAGLTDALFILEWTFNLGEEPLCADSTDVDDDGEIRALSEVVSLLTWFFLQGDAPPDPGVEECGSDPTADDVGCDAYECV